MKKMFLGFLLLVIGCTEFCLGDETVVFSENSVKELKSSYLDAKTDQHVIAFEAFIPQTPEHIDWCYEILDGAAISRDVIFEKLKKYTRTSLMQKKSNSWLLKGSKKQIDISLKIIDWKKDKTALSILLQAENKQEEPYPYFYYKIREIRAKLGDEVLLNELTSLDGQTPDSTLAQFNRDLLLHYGEDGFAKLQKLKGKSKEADNQIYKMMQLRGDKHEILELIKEFEQEDDYDKRTELLRILLKINSNECQELFRKLIQAKKPNCGEHIWLEHTYVVNLYEELGHALQKKIKKQTYYTYINPFPGQQLRKIELDLALSYAAKLSQKENTISYDAAKSLLLMTGQKFQYNPLALNTYVRIEIEKKTRGLNAQRLTPDMLEKDKLLELELVKKSTYPETYKQNLQKEINRKYFEDLKKFDLIPDWELGVPIEDAEFWLKNYYLPKVESNPSNKRK